MALCRKIMVVGFSGAGKSSFIRMLSEHPPVAWTRFNDLDEIILNKHGNGKLLVADLIDEVGMESFRRWETEEITSWLEERNNAVLALGGGALNQTLLDLYGRSPGVKFCYLHASFQTCFSRLKTHTQEPRPLLRLGESKLESIYLQRQKLFSQIDWVLDNDGEKTLPLLASQFWTTVLSS